MSNLSAAIKETAAEVAAELDRLLPVPATPEKRVVEAMRYSSNGKRLCASRSRWKWCIAIR